MPREETFFDLLDKASENLERASNLLLESLKNPQDLNSSARQIKAVEEDGDKIVHEVMAKLHSTFITPLDREDIHGLISALDDVLDFIENAADRFSLYRVSTVTPEAIDLAEIIARQTAEIHLMVPLLRHSTRDRILRHCVEINRLENAADGKLRDALEGLFVANAQPLRVIQWKEIYDL